MQHMNHQFDVVVGCSCNAKCGFCVQEITRKTRDRPEQWLSGLRQALRHFCDLKGCSAVITGGEPTLPRYARRSLAALEIIREFPDIDLLAVYTNGTGLLEKVEVEEERFLPRAARAGLTHVNLSCHHYDEAINNAVYQLNNRPSTATLIKATLELGLGLRLNCSLQQPLIETIQDV